MARKTKIFIYVLMFLSARLSGQQAIGGPMGVVITPAAPKHVSQSIRRQIGKNAVVRLLQATHLQPDGEQIIIYETGDEMDPHSHIAIIKAHKRQAVFDLAKMYPDIGDAYTLFQAGETPAMNGKRSFVTAFCNIGDGAGTILLAIGDVNGKYSLVLNEGTEQGRLKFLANGDAELWNADAGGECVWCPHIYKVTILHWQDGKATKLRSFRTRHHINPEISNHPIVFPRTNTTPDNTGK